MTYPGKSPAIRLLIVDDNRDVTDSLGALFEAQGFAVAVATSGNAALERYAADPADVVLVDLGMPHMNGFEVARQINNTRPKASLLIAITGWSRPGDEEAARAAGFDHYVTKPVDTGPIESLIRLAHGRRVVRPSGLRADGQVLDRSP